MIQKKLEATDTFIRKKRALFVKLANMPKESDQIDMILCFVIILKVMMNFYEKLRKF